jgi:hypothetical protein
MATLLELAQIDEWSRTDPDVGSPDSTANLARQLRIRIRMLLIRKAYQFIQGTPDPEGQEEIEQLAFAQQVLRNPYNHVDTAFNIALAQTNPALTITQILNVTDAQLDDVLSGPTLRLISLGFRPGR